MVKANGRRVKDNGEKLYQTSCNSPDDQKGMREELAVSTEKKIHCLPMIVWTAKLSDVVLDDFFLSVKIFHEMLPGVSELQLMDNKFSDFLIGNLCDKDKKYLSDFIPVVCDDTEHLFVKGFRITLNVDKSYDLYFLSFKKDEDVLWTTQGFYHHHIRAFELSYFLTLNYNENIHLMEDACFMDDLNHVALAGVTQFQLSFMKSLLKMKFMYKG